MPPVSKTNTADILIFFIFVFCFSLTVHFRLFLNFHFFSQIFFLKDFLSTRSSVFECMCASSHGLLATTRVLFSPFFLFYNKKKIKPNLYKTLYSLFSFTLLANYISYYFTISHRFTDRQLSSI